MLTCDSYANLHVAISLDIGSSADEKIKMVFLVFTFSSSEPMHALLDDQSPHLTQLWQSQLEIRNSNQSGP